MAPQIIQVAQPGAPPPPVTPASQPGGGAVSAPSTALTSPQPALAPDLAGRAAAAPSFAAAMDSYAAPGLTQAQTGRPDPNKSGFANFVGGDHTLLGALGMGTGKDAYSRTLANGPSPADYFADFFSGTGKQSGAALDAAADRAKFYADPAVRAKVTSNADTFNAAMSHPDEMRDVISKQMALEKNPLPMQANGKTVDNPQALAQIAAQTGEHPDVAHLFHEPHKYSEDEFVQRASGLSWNQASKLWGMQHYLSPDQQVFSQLMGGLKSQADQAGQMYQQLVQSGAPQGKIDVAKAAYDKARSSVVDVLTKKALGQTSIYPNTQPQE